MAPAICDKTYEGTVRKVSIEIDVPDFNMDVDYFEIKLANGLNKVVLHREDLVKMEDTWIMSVDTAQLGEGMIACVVTAHVPDGDYPSGYRPEVLRFNLMFVDGHE